MTRTILEYRDGKRIERNGTSGLTATATRTGDHVEVEMEFDIATKEEASSLVAMLLVQVEELCGERFMANCFAHYAEETGKEMHRQDDQIVFRIRGKKEGEREE